MYKEQWKNDVVILAEDSSLSLRGIAKYLKLPKSTVSDFYKKHKEICLEESYKELDNVCHYPYKEAESVVKKVGNPYYNPMPDYSRILVISDMHLPFHHPHTMRFLSELKSKYKPTFVVCMGDEADKSAMSYHESNTVLPSASDELVLAKQCIRHLENMFPQLTLLHSNHGSLALRKASTAGIPHSYLKSYNELYEVGDGWKWVDNLLIELPNGTTAMFTHGMSNDVTKVAKSAGVCVVQGHHHTLSKVEYFQNLSVAGKEKTPLWGMQLGCLINNKSEAFSYNKKNLLSPLINCGVIVNGKPEIVFMHEIIKEVGGT